MEDFNIQIPAPVQKAMDSLEAAGYEAYAVGGCVRNSMLGIPVNDWDMTTSATPSEMQKVFFHHRTVETGLKHGTLTVLMEEMPLEITTYRHDGEYLDNRHPREVTFSKCLEEDLCRRDFTVNAMAYHPKRGLVDLYGGREDLARRMIACVGDPETRFREDGLRILRALRFASVLDFSMDPHTAQAVHHCKELLRGIAAERIREELCKLLMGKGCVRILREYADVIGVFLPELYACVGFSQNSKYHCYDVWEHTLRALEYAPPRLMTRLAVLFHDVGKPLCYTEDAEGGHFKGHAEAGMELMENICTRLRFDHQTRERLVRLIQYHDRDIPATPTSVKRLMQKMSDEDISVLMEIKVCDRLAHHPDYRELSPAVRRIPLLVQELRAADACLSLKTLAVKGEDLKRIGVPPGKEMGALLNRLLDQVVEGVLPNEKEALLQFAIENKK